MTLNFPNRFLWIVIVLVIVFLMQGGCKPIQPEAALQPATSDIGTDRSGLSSDMTSATKSPNGEWIATTHVQVPREGEEYYQSLVVSHSSGAPTYTIVDGWFPMGLGYTIATPFYWSEDGERFYYTDAAQPDGCAVLTNGTDLYQVELGTGESKELLPPDTTMRIALSHDEQVLAYITIGEPRLRILNLGTNESSEIDLASVIGDDQAGALVWSPDNEALAFAVAHNPCMGAWAEATTIFRYDLEIDTFAPLIKNDTRLLVPTLWPNASTLLLQNQNGEQITLDLTNNSMEPNNTTVISATTPITL